MAASIMVPLDGSAFSEHALPVALGIARRTGARVHVVHCHEPPLPPLYPQGVGTYDEQLDRELRESEEKYLADVASKCMSRCGVAVRTQLLGCPTVASVIGHALETGIDLLVMTTHGRGGISRAWLGSVADAVVRRTSVPVLLLRPREEEVEFECEPQARHVLIPLDGSELSEGILEPAIALAQLSHARVTLLQAIGPARSAADDVAVAHTRASRHLADLAAEIRKTGLEVEVAVVFHALPAVAILDYAASHDVDLIALATHGRGGWSRMALGSVADKVVRGTLTPVLLYRPPAVVTSGSPLAGITVEHR